MAVEQRLRVSRRLFRGAVIISAAGEVDQATAPQLRSAVERVLQAPVGRPLILDLTGVGRLDRQGLDALVEVVKNADRADEPLRIVVDSQRPVIRPLQITGLSNVLELYTSVEQAISGRDPLSL